MTWLVTLGLACGTPEGIVIEDRLVGRRVRHLRLPHAGREGLLLGGRHRRDVLPGRGRRPVGRRENCARAGRRSRSVERKATWTAASTCAGRRFVATRFELLPDAAPVVKGQNTVIASGLTHASPVASQPRLDLPPTPPARRPQTSLTDTLRRRSPGASCTARRAPDSGLLRAVERLDRRGRGSASTGSSTPPNRLAERFPWPPRGRGRSGRSSVSSENVPVSSPAQVSEYASRPGRTPRPAESLRREPVQGRLEAEAAEAAT